MSIGFSELLVIIVLIIAFFKPDKLQDYVKVAASLASTLKDTMTKAKEVTQPLDEIVKPVTDLKNDINEQASQIAKQLSDPTALIKEDKINNKEEEGAKV